MFQPNASVAGMERRGWEWHGVACSTIWGHCVVFFYLKITISNHSNVSLTCEHGGPPLLLIQRYRIVIACSWSSREITSHFMETQHSPTTTYLPQCSSQMSQLSDIFLHRVSQRAFFPSSAFTCYLITSWSQQKHMNRYPKWNKHAVCEWSNSHLRHENALGRCGGKLRAKKQNKTKQI